MSTAKKMFTNSKIMLFKNVKSGEIIETTNMFYLAYPQLWTFEGYKPKQRKK